MNFCAEFSNSLIRGVQAMSEQEVNKKGKNGKSEK
jgi:hypothetical protein